MLIPRPDLLVPFTTSSSGGARLALTWPAAAPGARVHIQSWFLDPAAFGGLAATQGWAATQPQ